MTRISFLLLDYIIIMIFLIELIIQMGFILLIIIQKILLWFLSNFILEKVIIEPWLNTCWKKDDDGYK